MRSAPTDRARKKALWSFLSYSYSHPHHQAHHGAPTWHSAAVRESPHARATHVTRPSATRGAPLRGLACAQSHLAARRPSPNQPHSSPYSPSPRAHAAAPTRRTLRARLRRDHTPGNTARMLGRDHANPQPPRPATTAMAQPSRHASTLYTYTRAYTYIHMLTYGCHRADPRQRTAQGGSARREAELSCSHTPAQAHHGAPTRSRETLGA